MTTPRKHPTTKQPGRLAVHFLQDDNEWKTTERGHPCANCGEPDRLHPRAVEWSSDHGQHRCPTCRSLR